MKYAPLTKQQLTDVIEGRGRADRVPLFVHFWTQEYLSKAKDERVRALLDDYPQDAQIIDIRIPDVYQAPEDEPGYRWSHRDADRTGAPDNSGCIDDWDRDAEAFFADFPSPESPHLFENIPVSDGRYRLGHWWYFFFERFWSVRGMENALTDFYEYPDKVHALFRRLCDFYKRVLERAATEVKLDGIFTSDDLGTQTSTFFSQRIFDEFFAPYYKEVIDKAHELGMHFWLHACGNIEGFLPRFIDLGIDVIHPIQKYTMDEKRIASLYGDRICIWAGFDVQQIIPYGTPEEVRREVRYLIDTYLREDGRFMFTLGNQATQDTPYESLKALLEEACEYSRR